MKTFSIRSLSLIGFVFFLLFGTSIIQAQHVQISAHYNQGVQYNNNWDLFNGGAELSADYIFSQSNWSFSSGINFRTIQWGNQTSISLGFIRTIGERVELGAKIENGLALFYTRSLYVFGIGATCSITVIKKEKMSVGVSLGAKYSHCPAYKNYGQIYHLTEVPLGIFIFF